MISSPKNSQSTPEDWDHDHSMETASSRVVFPITIRIVPTPPREMRVLWDQFHNLRYPGGYFPRDSLFPMIQSHQKGPHSQDGSTHGEHGPTSQQQPLDWHADHVHTNFRELWLHLRSLDYYIDVLGEPYTCFDAENYGTLMIVDPEDEFFPEEIEKLSLDLTQRGLNLIVLAEWYNVKVMLCPLCFVVSSFHLKEGPVYVLLYSGLINEENLMNYASNYYETAVFIISSSYREIS